MLLHQLMQGNEQLLENIFVAHFEDCRRFLMKKYDCTYEQAYDVTMDTMLIFRKKLLDGKIEYGNLRYLFTKIASNRLYDIRIGEHKLKSYKAKLVTIPSQEEIIIEKEEIRILDLALDYMNENCRILLHKHFYRGMSLREIADSENKKPASVRKQKERCMQKLREVFRVLSEKI